MITGKEKAWVALIGSILALIYSTAPVSPTVHTVVGAISAILTAVLTYLTKNTDTKPDTPEA